MKRVGWEFDWKPVGLEAGAAHGFLPVPHRRCRPTGYETGVGEDAHTTAGLETGATVCFFAEHGRSGGQIKQYFLASCKEAARKSGLP
jgi:hypothetical protein